MPDAGYTFKKWSDNELTAARTDTSVQADLAVNAVFGKVPVTPGDRRFRRTWPPRRTPTRARCATGLTRRPPRSSRSGARETTFNALIVGAIPQERRRRAALLLLSRSGQPRRADRCADRRSRSAGPTGSRPRPRTTGPSASSAARATIATAPRRPPTATPSRACSAVVTRAITS